MKHSIAVGLGAAGPRGSGGSEPRRILLDGRWR